MPTIKRDDPDELLHQAIIALDSQIEDLQDRRSQLAAMIDGKPAGPAVKAAAPGKRRKLSAEQKAKISAAMKARWARARKRRA
jgi:hypothetical protein